MASTRLARMHRLIAREVQEREELQLPKPSQEVKHQELKDHVPKDTGGNRPGCEVKDTEKGLANTFTLDPRFGQPVDPKEIRWFCPLLALEKFAHRWLRREYVALVHARFFADGKYWNREWDLFYIHSLDEHKPLLLIPQTSFASLLSDIQREFPYLDLDPDDPFYLAAGIVVQFPEHPRFLPRFLGCCTSKAELKVMVENIPPFLQGAHYPRSSASPTPEMRFKFKQIVEDLERQDHAKAEKAKKQRERERLGRELKKLEQLRRAQRYLGLRPHRSPLDNNEFSTSVIPPKIFDPNSPVPHLFDQDLVFIAFDVEAYEHNPSVITELGIAILDSRDIQGVAPGKTGSNWFDKIRTRHIRINENSHLKNRDYVNGCEDRFEFGESEFLDFRHVSKLVAQVIKDVCKYEPHPNPEAAHFAHVPPVSTTLPGSGVTSGKISDSKAQAQPVRRKFALIGHAPIGDCNMIASMGCNPLNYANLLEVLDTGKLFEAWRNEQQPRSLTYIIDALGFVAWHPHNAGNDAVYSLWAFLGTCVQASIVHQDIGATMQEETLSKLARMKLAQEEIEEEHRTRQLAILSQFDGGPAQKPEQTVGQKMAVERAHRPQYTPGGLTSDGNGRGNGGARRRHGGQLKADAPTPALADDFRTRARMPGVTASWVQQKRAQALPTRAQLEKLINTQQQQGNGQQAPVGYQQTTHEPQVDSMRSPHIKQEQKPVQGTPQLAQQGLARGPTQGALASWLATTGPCSLPPSCNGSSSDLAPGSIPDLSESVNALSHEEPKEDEEELLIEF